MTNIIRPKLGTYIAGVTTLAVLAFGLVIALPSLLTAQTSSAAGLLKYDNPYGAAVAKPSVDRDWLVYVDYRDSSTAHLYTYNYKINEEKMISWGVDRINGAVTRPVIDDGYVVYNNKLSDGTYVMNHFNPYMYLTKEVASSSQKMSAPSFDKGNIVWTQSDADVVGASHVYWFDADRNVLTKLSKSTIARRSAVVRGTIAYWVEENGNGFDIVKFDLDKNIRKVIVSNKQIVGSISASGDEIAFAVQSGLQSDIFTVNTVTRNMRQITSTGSDELNPKMRGVYIVYDEIVGDKDAEIAVYSKSNGTKTLITNDELTHDVVSLTDTRLAWSDTRSGLSQIYFYDFRSSGDKIHFDLARKTVTSITDPQPTAPAIPATDLLDKDTDGDGITDSNELNHYMTKPKSYDSDGDGLNDYEELFVYKTDPNKFDTDEDGFGDGREVLSGHSPLLHANKSSLYGVTRFDLAVEHARAVQLKHALEAKLGKGNIGIHRNEWPFYANAYMYGGYSIDEIIKSSHGTYGVISANIRASEWRSNEMYLKAMAF